MRMWKLLRFVLAGLAGAWITRQVLRSLRTFGFGGKVVLIVGGSRGLGLVMARQMAEEGARLALVARSPQDLQEAQRQLRVYGVEAVGYSCDVRNRNEVRKTVEAVNRHFGRVDVLINDAGVIEVGPIESMTEADFEEAMQTHFWGPLHFMVELIPQMKQRKSGRIVNISSIGGKISVPHLLPYSASKFALSGLSAGMRAELLKNGVLVTSVYPGMMRTGSHLRAWFKGQNRAEYAWFSLGNALPFFSVSAENAARQVIRAARNGDPELIISMPAQIASKLQGVFPGLTEDVLGFIDRFLPSANGNGFKKVLGRDSKSWISPSILTKLSDDAASRNNELSA